ncbi:MULTISPECIES: cardiolipin synthase [unclassified Microbacterium]|jgi:cardiolipin synthase|uniref:cardiolipin synthase n=1 Tax=unclassified Microbacterium TaxID=2609290 RepID=UPI000CFCC5F6|nr:MULTISPECIES: cardiolipin synthase [unclassified Microbacterium]PQZ58218.1 cardiolipin synthase [Microbacterium sp. MYb43]PQZ78387.1 cardiolipin synthase [Microbacterium sp. MYb40]PRB20617.1 cardiolipin synthase [Microbacterium sp. MYb54]PRB28297.1 cardiolipin synthase [Microbacterium sp. MYb50]PRB66639.1 cardiolipin synthase [Microbacterium sp. MYb24]
MTAETWGWWIAAFLVALDLVIRVTAIIVIPRNRRPTAAMAWLLAVFFIPYVGVFLFLVIGNPRLPRVRRRKQDQINEYIAETSEHLHFGTLRPNAPAWFGPIVQMNQRLGALPLSGDNGAHLISDYQESLDAMAEAIRSAQKYVHVEFYILQSDTATDNFFRALEEVAARGIEVRVLLDHWANRGKPRYKQTLARLNAMGADWHLMLPVQPLKGKMQRPDLRNHRKLLVVDGSIAFVGSQNVTDSTYNLPKNIKRGLHWVDLMVRIDGPVVLSVNAIFVADWYSETDTVLEGIDIAHAEIGSGDLDCQVVPSGPGFEVENNLRLFLALLYAAKKKIMIVSPYFVPDEALLLAVTAAVDRGVHVELFVSEEGDQAMVYHAQRSYYEVLLKAGVRIWMYRKPYILHTKTLTIDDEVAVIGSSNMDMRSFGLNLEVSMLVRGEEFVAEMREVEDKYRSLSRELTLEEWMQQPLRSTVLDNLARLTSALQ